MGKQALAAAIVVLSFGLAAAEDRPLVVQLASRRSFAGRLGANSSGEVLMLETGNSGLALARPIRWERVVAATLGGQPIDVAELKQLALQPSAAAAASPAKGRRIVIPSHRPALIEQAEATAAAPPAAPPAPVATISFDAFVANWDGDVVTDGLVLDLLPLDNQGFVTPAGGTIEVELFAAQRRTLHHAPRSGGDTLELVERWTRAIEPEDIGPGGIRLRLPFGAVHPELDYEWLAYNYGLVHVRFACPGSGVFDDSRDGIRIRPWAPNRDYLEMNTRRRFLPTENLGRRN